VPKILPILKILLRILVQKLTADRTFDCIAFSFLVAWAWGQKPTGFFLETYRLTNSSRPPLWSVPGVGPGLPFLVLEPGFAGRATRLPRFLGSEM